MLSAISGVTKDKIATALFNLQDAATEALGGEAPTLVKISTSKDAFELETNAMGFMMRGLPASATAKSLAEAVAEASGKSAYIAIAGADGTLEEKSSSMTDTEKEAAKSRLTDVVKAAVEAKGKLGTEVTLANVQVVSATYDVRIYPAS